MLKNAAGTPDVMFFCDWHLDDFFKPMPEVLRACWWETCTNTFILVAFPILSVKFNLVISHRSAVKHLWVVDGLNKILLFYSCLPVIAAGFWKVWLLGGWKRSPTIRTCTLITKWCTFIVGCVLPLHCCMILHYIALSTTWWRSCFYSKFINWIMWVIGDTMLE